MTIGLSGQLTQSRYVQLFRSIELSALSGRLQIRSGRIDRQIHFVDGQLVGFTSNLPEDTLAHTLLEKKFLTAKSLRWHEQHSNDDMSLAHSLVESGVIEELDLVSHHTFRIVRGVGSLLGVKAGEWTFVSMPWISREVLSEKIAPSISNVGTLWKGVQEKLNSVELMQMIPIPPTKSFRVMADVLPILSEIDVAIEVIEALEGEEAKDLEQLVSLSPDTPEDIMRLVWFLYHYGALDCSSEYKSLVQDLLTSSPIERIRLFDEPISQSTDTTEEGEVPEKRSARLRRLREHRRQSRRTDKQTAENTPQEVVSNTEKKPKKSKSDIVAKEFSERMGQNFYDFAGVAQADPYSKIDRSIKLRLKKWVAIYKSGELDENARANMKKLIDTMKKVHKVLTSPDKRTQYDRKVHAGNADLAGAETVDDAFETPKKSSRFNDIPAPIEKLIEAERFADALPKLKHLRFENPSSVEVLTYLGWAIWVVEKNTQDARDWLQMALTFDGSYVAAIGYLAKIALAKGDTEHAKRYLRRVLQLKPDEAWAKVAFDDLKKNK